MLDGLKRFRTQGAVTRRNLDLIKSYVFQDVRNNDPSRDQEVFTWAAVARNGQREVDGMRQQPKGFWFGHPSGNEFITELFDDKMTAVPPALYTFGCMLTGTVLARLWRRQAV